MGGLRPGPGVRGGRGAARRQRWERARGRGTFPGAHVTVRLRRVAPAAQRGLELGGARGSRGCGNRARDGRGSGLARGGRFRTMDRATPPARPVVCWFGLDLGGAGRWVGAKKEAPQDATCLLPHFPLARAHMRAFAQTCTHKHSQAGAEGMARSAEPTTPSPGFGHQNSHLHTQIYALT